MNRTPFKIIALFFLIIIITLSLLYRNETEEPDRPNIRYQYQIDEKMINLQIVENDLNDQRPKYFNYQYDSSSIFVDEDVIDLIPILNDEISVFSLMKEETENGEVIYVYSEGEYESRIDLKVSNNGNIQYEYRKLVGFTEEISDKDLFRISNETRDLISDNEVFVTKICYLIKTSKVNEDRSFSEIGSFYWISFDQIIDGLPVRSAYVSLNVRNGDIIGYTDHRFHSDKMERIEELPELYTSEEASEFAIINIAEEYCFKTNDLSIENRDLFYGLDEVDGIITPVYSFEVAKDHRSYYTMVYADTSFGGEEFL